MKHIVNTLLILLITQNVISQTLITQAKPMGEKLWGYINLQGDLIIPAKYTTCYEFTQDGYAVIKEEKQYYFINKKGEKLKTEVKGFKLSGGLGVNLRGFDNGVVPIKIGNTWGYMNLLGKVVIKATFDKVSGFNDGHAVAQRGNEKFVLDVKGTEISVTDNKVMALKPFSEGMAPFNSHNKKSGFIDITGKVVIEPIFMSVGYFKDGLAWAKMPDNTIGYINTKGEWVIKPQFTATKDFDVKSGMARVKIADQWAYVDKTGKVMNVETVKFGDFSEGLAQGRKNDSFGFFDNTGKWVIEPQFEGVRDFKNGYAAAKKDGKWGMIDTAGKWIIQPVFAGIKDMELVN